MVILISNNHIKLYSLIGGGESGIRTHGTCEGTHTFQACALNHSAISPEEIIEKHFVLIIYKPLM